VTGDDTDSKRSPVGSNDGLTRIDLGDDLVEKTAIIPGRSTSSETEEAASAPPKISPDEQIKSARAYLGEGFPEDAKKILRQVLLADPQSIAARKLLDEINEAELKQMIGNAEPIVRKSLFDTYDDSILHVDSDEIIRLLDRDMGIGETLSPVELSLFSDAKLLAEFATKLDQEIGGHPQDRVDMAIGFIEMGLHAVAIKLLQPLASSADSSLQLNACALIAYSHINSDEPYKAISVLQPILNDNDIERSKKTESFYLMGRALQFLKSYREAIDWYLQAQEFESNYRDSIDRISRCRAALTK
jgi:tetratricopeptide (TPR) repeat protein